MAWPSFQPSCWKRWSASECVYTPFVTRQRGRGLWEYENIFASGLTTVHTKIDIFVDEPGLERTVGAVVDVSRSQCRNRGDHFGRPSFSPPCCRPHSTAVKLQALHCELRRSEVSMVLGAWR